MKAIETRSALKIIYYLIAADGIIKDEELDKFAEIGEELDRKHFDSYKDRIIAECMSGIESGKEDGDLYYDILLEGVDEALTHVTVDPDRGLIPRLLLWNLLAVAFCDNDFDKSEKRLIQHVARRLNVDNSVIPDMIQLIQATHDVTREKEWVMSSNLPYAKAKPIVDELEDREVILFDAAKALIVDEAVLDDPYVDVPDVFDNVAKQVGGVAKQVSDAAAPVAKAIGDTANKAKNAVADAVSPVASQAAYAAADFFKGLGGMFGKRNQNHHDNKQKHEKEVE